MKKTLLFASLLTFSTAINAQTIRDTNVANLGDTIYSATDVAPSISLGTTGIGNTWDFSTLLINSRDTIHFSSPSTIPCAITSFSTASYKMKQDTLMVFLEKNVSKLELLGISDGTFCAPSQNPETFIEFPSTYGSTFSDTTLTQKELTGAQAATLPGVPSTAAVADSVKFVSTTNVSSNFNASGSLTTPFGVFNCIRQYLVRYTKTDVYGKGALTGGVYTILTTINDTAYSHQYWSDNSKAKFPLVTYDIDAAGNLTGDVSWTTKFVNSSATSISEIEKRTISIYPNPVQNTLTIDNQDAINAVSIMDITGKVVFRSENRNDKTLNVDFLNKGIYIISIETDTYLGTSKFIKQ